MNYRRNTDYPKQNSNFSVTEAKEQRRMEHYELKEMQRDVLDSIVWYGRVSENLSVFKFLLGILIFVLIFYSFLARQLIPIVLILLVIYMILRAIKIKVENKKEELSQLHTELFARLIHFND